MIILSHISRFIAVVLLQVLLFNHIFFLGYMNPYLYIIFLLYLPVSIYRGSILVIGFILGLCIDVFENSGGIHAAATTVLAYLRISLLKIAGYRHRTDTDIKDIRVKNLSFTVFLFYASAGIFIHHFSMFILETFDWRDIGLVLIRTIYSSLFTLFFVLIYQFWNFRRGA